MQTFFASMFKKPTDVYLFFYPEVEDNYDKSRIV